MPLLIERPQFHAAWDVLGSHLLIGEPYAPRGKKTLEICGVALRVEDLRSNILVNTGRDLGYRFMVAEFLWIALGRKDVESIARFNPNITKFSDDGKNMYGAYGPRLIPQMDRIRFLLQKDADTRQAVVDIFGQNMRTDTKDVPCTLSIQWLLREDKLNCIVTMRSSDYWLGLPYDFYTFSQLTNALAGDLKVDTGWMQMNLGSAHVYEENFELVRKSQSDWKSYSLRSPRLPGWPPEVLHFMLDGMFDQTITGWENELDDPTVKYLTDVLSQPTKVRALGALKRWIDESETGAPGPAAA